MARTVIFWWAALVTALAACAPTPPLNVQTRPTSSGETSVSKPAPPPPPGTSWCENFNADELVAGVGACAVDADCELTSYQEGCCTQACAPSARSRADLARAKSAENCVAVKKKHPSCPPPSPCQPPSYEPTAAACCGGTCMTARRQAR